MYDKHGIAIVNPKAGGYATSREWPLIDKYLKDKNFPFDVVFTEDVGHAIELARDAADKDYRYIIAVGGDGTLNEVVNGMLSSTKPGNPILGIVNSGTTCSFARSLGIPRYYVKAFELPAGNNHVEVDVGVVEYTANGQRQRRYFINEADIGFGATVVEAAKKYKHYFGRSINYLPHVVGGFTSLVSYKNKNITVTTGDTSEIISDCAMLVIANGTHFGGGMQMAPGAKPNDGLLDMVIFSDMKKSELLKVWPMTYRGNHVSHEKVRTVRVKQVEITCDDTILVEADGELLGEGPVSFSVSPAALKILVP